MLIFEINGDPAHDLDREILKYYANESPRRAVRIGRELENEILEYLLFI